jgi:hypothetical protein
MSEVLGTPHGARLYDKAEAARRQDQLRRREEPAPLELTPRGRRREELMGFFQTQADTHPISKHATRRLFVRCVGRRGLRQPRVC